MTFWIAHFLFLSSFAKLCFGLVLRLLSHFSLFWRSLFFTLGGDGDVLWLFRQFCELSCILLGFAFQALSSTLKVVVVAVRAFPSIGAGGFRLIVTTENLVTTTGAFKEQLSLDNSGEDGVGLRVTCFWRFWWVIINSCGITVYVWCFFFFDIFFTGGYVL